MSTVRPNGNKALVLATAWAINSLAYSIIYPFIPIYLKSERGIAMSTVGLIFPAMGAAIIFMPPLVGMMTDRIGRLPVMCYGQSIRGILFVFLAVMVYFHAPFWLFLIMLTLNAGVGTLFQIGADAFLTDITTPEERPRAYSMIRIGTNVGWGIGPMLGALLARTPFWLLFIATAILCFVGELYTRKRCNFVVERPKKREAEVAVNFSLHRILRDTIFLQLLTGSFLLYLLTSQLYSIMSVYATGVVGISKEALGLVYSLNGMVIIFCQLPVSRLLDVWKWTLGRRMFWGCAFYALGYFSLGFALNWQMVALAVAVLTLGETIAQPAIYSAVTGRAPSEGMGRYLAALGLVRGVGYSLGPYIGSLAFQQFNRTPLLLWGLLSLLGLAAIVPFGKAFAKKN